MSGKDENVRGRILRTTERRRDIPREIGVLIRKEYSEVMFRPTLLTERLTQSSIPGEVRYPYEVKVSGPVQTASGKDHKTSRGARTFGGWHNPNGDEIPDEIKVLLRGPDALAAATYPDVTP